MHSKTTLFFGTVLLYSKLFAQVYIPGDESQPLDLLNDTTALNFYTSVKTPSGDGFWIVDPQVRFTYNSAYPRGYNDGPVWKGKGLTSEVHAGVYAKKGILSYAFVPVVYHSQNGSFNWAPRRISTIDSIRYQFARGIDTPFQFGTSSFTAFHPGQSELKITWGKFVTSISSQNYLAGPSGSNSILLSRHAAGFPSFRLGIAPVNLKIKNFNLGKLETNYLTGLLLESDYFDENTLNDRRYFNSLFIAFSPAAVPNLTLSFNRTMYKDTRYFEWIDVISPIKIVDNGQRGDTLFTGNDTFDGLAALSINWTFPSVGFRAYGEFSRNDFTGGLHWTMLEPEHSRAYNIGFEKSSQLSFGELRLSYEHTNLSRNHTYLWRAAPTFYVHHINQQGYTHQGQVLGSGIGPGGNSDLAMIRLNQKKQSLALTLQRIEFNKDFFVTNIQNNTGNQAPMEKHDMEYTAGIYYHRTLRSILVSGQVMYSKNFNRFFQEDVTNLQLGLSAKWLLSQ